MKDVVELFLDGPGKVNFLLYCRLVNLAINQNRKETAIFILSPKVVMPSMRVFRVI